MLCIDSKGSIVRSELLVAPDFVELRTTMCDLDFAFHATGSRFRLHAASITSHENGDPFSFTGRFLGFRYGRAVGRWWLWAGVDTFAMAHDSIRYFVPSLGIDVGSGMGVRASFAVLSTGLYGAAIDDNGPDGPPRAIGRDFDIEGRVTMPETRWFRIQARGRYRDGVIRESRVRDVFAALGIELAAPYGYHQRWLPTFVGIGMRRVIDREPPAIVVRDLEPTPSATGWQLLAWLELDIGFESSAMQ